MRAAAVVALFAKYAPGYGTRLAILCITRQSPASLDRAKEASLQLQMAVKVSSAGLTRIAIVACAFASLPLGLPVQAFAFGSAVEVTERMSTQERVDKQGWWPTKLLPSRKDFVGSEACAQCHASVASSVRDTEMAKALLRPGDSEVLRARDGQSFRLDSYLYKLEQTPQGHTFTVSHGSDSDSTSQPITWAFGEGNISQVYITEKQGTFYESHFSYYGGSNGFDRTTNQPRQAQSIQSAVGRIVMPDEMRKCFACHAAAVVASGGFNDVILGVTCEACHGPGADHVAAMKAGVEGGEAFILNPARLDRVAAVDFCGSCHMTWIDVQMGDLLGPPTVRFPAYRLQNSRCWEKGDARIACVGCHDPHQPLVHSTDYYDQKCLSCHVNRAATAPTKDHPGKGCPQADHNCASCHMPKQDFPDTHHAFTDHDIRIVRAGEPVPN